jgi:hypothetical protein
MQVRDCVYGNKTDLKKYNSHIGIEENTHKKEDNILNYDCRNSV